MSDLRAYFEEIDARGHVDGNELRFASAWECLESAFLDRLAAATSGVEDWRDRFRAAATEVIELVESHRREARFLAVDALTAGELGRTRQLSLAAKVAEMVDCAREQLEDPDSVPPATAPWIVGIFFDRIYRRCATGAGPDLRLQLPELCFLAISAYFGTDAGLRELFPSA